MKHPLVRRGSQNAAMFGASLFLLYGCSSSDRSVDQQAQAIDGYVVNAEVSCDDVVQTETTGLGGSFSCPAGTELYTIRGGIDVGFDELEDQDGEVFLGEMKGTSELDYVTPMTTVLVSLATDSSGEYNPSRFDTAVETLSAALGVTVDPNADASADLDTVKLNAQLQTIINQFVDSTEDYNAVVEAFTATIETAASTAEPIDMVTAADTLLTSINTILITQAPSVAKNTDEITNLAAAVEATNRQIIAAEGPDGITLAAAQAVSSGHVLTINRDTLDVILGSSDGTSDQFNLTSFESNSVNSDGQYTVVVSDNVDTIGFDRNAIIAETSVEDQAIELAFDIDGTDDEDSRKLSVATDALLTMTEGDNASINITVPEGTVMNVTAIESDGTQTDASFTVSGERTFSSANDSISINLETIEQKLADNDITGFLDRSGNYLVTMIVGGVRVAETVENVDALLSPYTVVTERMTVNGTGFRGYATFLGSYTGK